MEEVNERKDNQFANRKKKSHGGDTMSVKQRLEVCKRKNKLGGAKAKYGGGYLGREKEKWGGLLNTE